MMVAQHYKRFQKFPVYKNNIQIYSPSTLNDAMAEILSKQDKFVAFDLANESGLSKYLIQKFQKGNAKGNTRVFDLYVATQVVDNPKFSKIRTKRKKISLLNPHTLRQQFREVSITDDKIKSFLQGQFAMEKVIYNMQSKNVKTFTFDLLTALTACHKYYSKYYVPRADELARLAPNTRRLREKNDRIERYFSGDLSSIQEKS